MNKWIKENNGMIVVFAIILISVVIACFLFGGNNTTVVSTQNNPIYLSASADKIELGDSVKFFVSGKVDFSTDIIQWESKTWNAGRFKEAGDNEIIFTPRSTGIIDIVAIINDKEYFYQIEVFNKPVITTDIPAWVYTGEKYEPRLETVGIDSTKVWIEDQWKVRTDLKNEFIFIEEAGNYELVIEGTAEMDGRIIRETVPFTALTEVVRGWHEVSFENEDLYGLKPSQVESVEIWLNKELGIDVSLEKMTEGKEKSINRINAQYMLYRGGADNTLCYQEEVQTGSDTITRKFWTGQFKSDDGRYYTVGYDKVIVTVNADYLGSSLNYFSYSSGSSNEGSSSSGGSSSTGSGGRGTG